jgi:hypothetical protein
MAFCGVGRWVLVPSIRRTRVMLADQETGSGTPTALGWQRLPLLESKRIAIGRPPSTIDDPRGLRAVITSGVMRGVGVRDADSLVVRLIA